MISPDNIAGFDPQNQTPYEFVTGQVIDSNIFGNDLGGTGTYGLPIFNFPVPHRLEPPHVSPTNGNLILNARAAWSSDLANANSAAPGQYTGNTINTTAATGQGANLATLLAQECSIRTGNRADLLASCTNPTPPTL